MHYRFQAVPKGIAFRIPHPIRQQLQASPDPAPVFQQQTEQENEAQRSEWEVHPGSTYRTEYGQPVCGGEDPEKSIQ